MTIPVSAREATGHELLRREVPLLALGVGTLGLARFLSRYDVASGPILCPLRRLTGVPCPFCGMTTSFSHLAGGRVSQAFIASPGGPILFAVTVVAVMVLAWALVRRRRIQVSVSDRTREIAFRVAVVTMIVLMVYQNFRIGPLHRLIS